MNSTDVCKIVNNPAIQSLELSNRKGLEPTSSMARTLTSSTVNPRCVEVEREITLRCVQLISSPESQPTNECASQCDSDQGFRGASGVYSPFVVMRFVAKQVRKSVRNPHDERCMANILKDVHRTACGSYWTHSPALSGIASSSEAWSEDFSYLTSSRAWASRRHFSGSCPLFSHVAQNFNNTSRMARTDIDELDHFLTKSKLRTMRPDKQTRTPHRMRRDEGDVMRSALAPHERTLLQSCFQSHLAPLRPGHCMVRCDALQ
jgi:hypothetical protein